MNRFLIVVLLASLVHACLEIDTASEIPFLKYKDHELTKGFDSLGNERFEVILTVEYEDGDGDIGYPESALRQDSTLFLNVFTIKNKLRFDSTMYYYKPPYLPRPNTIRLAIGEIEIKCPLSRIVKDRFEENDTIEAEMFLIDRAGNKSNTIITPKIKLTLEN